MLVCQRCKQAKASVHVTDCFGDTKEWHLCEECAAAEGIIRKADDDSEMTAQAPPTTTNVVLHELLKQKSSPRQQDVTCPQCGLTFREFRVSGQLGCPYDYTAFREPLLALLERAHEGASQHVGKVPTQADAATQRHLDLARLRRELKQAVEQEDYERAATVRDEIATLESA